jgi:copper chaperone CopZ
MKNEHETILHVSGMTCGACVRHVDGALRKVSGVEGVEVDLAASRARVRHGAETDDGALVAAVTKAGYGAQPIEDA